MAPRFLFGISLILLGLMISISSSSPLGMWLGLELNLLGMVPLLATHSREYTSFSGVTYYCYQAVGSVLFLFGGIMWSTLMILGLVIKLGAAPLHGWVPVVLGGTSWSMALLLLTIQKLAPLFLMGFCLGTFSGLVGLVLVSAYLSAIVGGLGGFSVARLSELVAYSSILNMGWLLFLGSQSVGSAYFFFLAIYFVVTAFLVLSTWGVEWDMPGSRMSWGVGVSLLSLAGLPPLVGFIPKMMAFLTVGALPLVPLVLGSLLALYYYLSSSLSLVFGGSSYLLFETWPKLLISMGISWNVFGGFFCLLLLALSNAI